MKVWKQLYSILENGLTTEQSSVSIVIQDIDELRKHSFQWPWYQILSLGLVCQLVLLGIMVPIWLHEPEDKVAKYRMACFMGCFDKPLPPPPPPKRRCCLGCMTTISTPLPPPPPAPLPPKSRASLHNKGLGIGIVHNIPNELLIYTPPIPTPPAFLEGNGNNAKSNHLDGWLIPDPTLEEDSTLEVILELEREPDISACMFISELVPEPINLDSIKRLIQYPVALAEADIYGLVVVRVFLDKRGKYRKHTVMKSTHPLLSEEIEQYLPYLQFTPAIQGNRPINSMVHIPFRLEP